MPSVNRCPQTAPTCFCFKPDRPTDKLPQREERPCFMSYSPAVRTALEAVDEDYYTLRPDGNLVTQSTACWLIAATLDTLDVRPGMRVLEIGTGSGFSGALLSELVGPVGTVVSVDVVPGLIERARELHARQGRANIQLLTDDGGKGAPGHGTFDRIVAWTTPDLLPQAWADQAEPGAVIITPVRITGRARTNAILTASVPRTGASSVSPSQPADTWRCTVNRWTNGWCRRAGPTP